MSLSSSLKDLVAGGPWIGTPSDLAAQLDYETGALKQALAERRDQLAQLGVYVESQQDESGRKLILIRGGQADACWDRETGWPDFDFGLGQGDRLAQALHLDRCGICLIPCAWESKRPTLNWMEFQTRRPNSTELGRWTRSRSNFAIVCGAISGVVVVDLDSQDALDWANEHLPITHLKTVTGVKEGGFRGEHWFYRHPGSPVGNKAGMTLSDGRKRAFDIRGDGGYVMAPGSMHESGVLYEAIGDWLPEAFQTLPVYPSEDLVDLGPSLAPSNPNAPLPENLEDYTDEQKLERAQLWIANRQGAVSGQKGDLLTWNTACALVRGFCLDDATALGLLEEWNQRCVPPWTTKKLDGKIRSAHRSGKEPYGYLLVKKKGNLSCGAAYQAIEVPDWAGPGPGRPGPAGPSNPKASESSDTPKQPAQGKTGESSHAQNEGSPAGEIDPDETEKNDDGNALAFIGTHQDRLKFCHDVVSWYVWRQPVWQKDQTQLHKALYLQFCRRQLENSSMDNGKRWFAALNHGKVNAALSLAQANQDIACMMGDFDQRHWELNLQNGTYDLKTRELKPHNREDMHTKVMPLSYDADATCPIWERFLLEIMGGDQELVDYLQRVVGYTLTGETREEVFFFLYGIGANGKSTFLEVLKRLMGNYGKSAEFSTFTEEKDQAGKAKPEIIALIGARLVMASESGQTATLDTGLIKKMTGRDTMSARDLYKGMVEFEPVWKIFLVANHKPTIKDNSIGTWRRLHLIPFTVTIPNEKKDENLRDKLLAELPGILNWALAGCFQWQKTGLKPPTKITAASKDYQDEMDPVGRFLADCCVTGHYNAYHTPAKAIFEEYQAWCNDSGEKEWSQNAFGRALASKGYERKKTNGNIVWHGIGLKADIPEPGNKIQEEMDF